MKKSLVKLVKNKKFFIGLLLLVIVVVVLLLKIPRYYVEPRSDFEPSWGLTFSKKYVEELELDWQKVYLAILDDLNVTKIRIPVYWDDIAPNSVTFNFKDYDWLISEAAKRNVQVILTVGEKLPRWPECHTPVWTKKLTRDEQIEALYRMIGAGVKHFKNYGNIKSWQIENEPLVNWFGHCQRGDKEVVKEEVGIVRGIDERPIILTDSGELGGWKKTYNLGADFLGITTYRVTWNTLFGYFRYPLPPSFYRLKAKIAGISWDKIIVVELQAEPWIPRKKDVISTPLAKQYISMNREQFKANLNYARALEVKEAYIWGAEWWYWLKTQGDDSMWNEAKTLWQ